MANEDIKTLVMSRKAGDKFVLTIDEQLILDILVISIGKKEVCLSFRVSDRVKIATLKALFARDKGAR